MKQFKYKFKGNSSPESIFENNLDIKDKKDETKKERSQLVFYKNTQPFLSLGSLESCRVHPQLFLFFFFSSSSSSSRNLEIHMAMPLSFSLSFFFFLLFLLLCQAVLVISELLKQDVMVNIAIMPDIIPFLCNI